MRLAPTHAASGAQRRDRAAFIINLSSRDDVYRSTREDCSFICAPTPARCFAENWRAGGRCADGSGGRFHGSGAVPSLGTPKRLRRRENCAGSTGSTVSALPDVSAGVCGGACVKASAYFYGTTGTAHNIYRIETVSGSKDGSTVAHAVEPWNRAASAARQVAEIAADPNKITGGYGATPSTSSSCSDLGLDAGGGGGKFWGRNAADLVVAGADRGGRAARGVKGRNGGFPPFLGGAIGCVGMAALECQAIVAPFQGFAPSRCQPAGLRSTALGGLGDGGVVDADREGGTPPNRPRLSPSSQAQPIFLVSTDLRIAGRHADPVGRDGRFNSCVEMGSGVCGLSLVARDRREGADHQKRLRVGGQSKVLGWGRSAETTTLWGGSTRVN